MSPASRSARELLLPGEDVYLSRNSDEELLIECSRHGLIDPLPGIFDAVDSIGWIRLRPCSVCPCFVPIRHTGRTADYCCAACRKAAQRRRRRGEPVADNGEQRPLRESEYPGLQVPATLPYAWEALWNDLSVEVASPEEGSHFITRDITLVPLWWHRVDARMDGSDLILYETTYHKLGRLRIRANDYPIMPKYTLLVGEPGSEIATLDFNHWPYDWARRPPLVGRVRGDRGAR